MLQRFGTNLSGMVMPNIGAFIAWGLITALFIETGWMPNEKLAHLVNPMITYLLPLLIGYTGGKIVYDTRGGVVGSIATMGIISGADIPMFIGAMIMGPIGGIVIKKFDQLFQNKIKTGFEMLVNNFSSGILGAILAILATIVINPIVVILMGWLSAGVNIMISLSLLPLVNLFIEPSKILFLNNAINHGILSPLAIEQVHETGKSVLFLLEANPGPGLGVLLAYSLFAKGGSKNSAPGAIIIHFFGGIHEIYFPYILMKPMLILAVLTGGVAGTFTFTILDAGLVSAPSPGSIIAILALTHKSSYIAVISGIIAATLISFIVSLLILNVSKSYSDDIESAAQKLSDLKGEKGSVLKLSEAKSVIESKNIKKIVFACDAGMGSSAMGASILRKKVTEASLNVEVTNTSISNLSADTDIVITHKDLTSRARAKLPDALHVSVENFLNSPKYDELINSLKKQLIEA